MRTICQLIFFYACVSLPVRAGETVISLALEEDTGLVYKAFNLSHEAEIRLQGWGLSQPEVSEDGLFRELVQAAWIINSNSREKVWHVLADRHAHRRFLGSFPIDETLRLPAGSYEVYMAGFLRTYEKVDKRFKVEAQAERKPSRFEVKGPSDRLSPVDGKGRFDELTTKTVVSINRARSRKHEVRYFRLKDDTRLRLYAMGEGMRRSGSIFDNAWIEDLTRRRKVWTLNPRTSEHAGGSRKNIRVREIITLAAGKYAVHFESDGSHGFGDWADTPPYDPNFWGITLWPDREEDVANVVVVHGRKRVEPVLEMTEVGDNQRLVQGMELLKDMSVRVLCVGEGVYGAGMVDYGWLEHADTGELAWTMSWKGSLNAGGVDKNRMVNKLLFLKKGRYLVRYQSDDTHSFPHWNAAAPFKPKQWGISIYPLEPENARFVTLFKADLSAREKPLVALLKPTHNAYLEANFILDTETRIRVVAIGESHEQSMVDFGWIEDDRSGEVVWQMAFEETRHAGGDVKNRKAETVLTLPPGPYRLIFETDDSHDFGAFNRPPPAEPEQYGIALYLLPGR